MGHVIRFAHAHELDKLIAVDDDACELYARAGIMLRLAADSPFVAAEQLLWRRALEMQRVFVAADNHDQPLGFAALDVLDGVPYLDQLSVRMSAMRHGVGRALLQQAIDWAAAQHARHVWLTTYAHVPWNRPWYERMGFASVPKSQWPLGIAYHMAEQCRFLPDPEQRVAMRRAL